MKVSNKLPAIQSLVDKLEVAGYKVRLHHDSDWCGTGVINGLPYRGVTYVDIDSDLVAAQGMAYCGINDHYNRVEGTKIAMHKAIRDLHRKIGRERVKEILS